MNGSGTKYDTHLCMNWTESWGRRTKISIPHRPLVNSLNLGNRIEYFKPVLHSQVHDISTNIWRQAGSQCSHFSGTQQHSSVQGDDKDTDSRLREQWEDP